MDEKDQKIQEMEQKLEEMQREMDALKGRPRQFQYGEGVSKAGTGSFRYDQRPVPPPKVRSLRIALVVTGSLAALAAVVAVVLFLVFRLVNTGAKDSPAMAEQIIQAIVEEDADGAYALTYPGALDREGFDWGFAEMCAMWHAAGGGDTFELKRTSWSMNASGGITQYTSVYEVVSGEANFSFKLVRSSKGDSTWMTSAQIAP